MCNVIASFQSVSRTSAQLSHEKHKSMQTQLNPQPQQGLGLLLFASARLTAALLNLWLLSGCSASCSFYLVCWTLDLNRFEPLWLWCEVSENRLQK